MHTLQPHPADRPAPPPGSLPGPGPAGSGGASLAERVERLALALERMNLADYADLTRRPWRLFWVNFAAGTARGLGIAFGFTVVTALAVRVLTSTAVKSIPLLGSFIAEVVRMVQLNLRP